MASSRRYLHQIRGRYPRHDPEDLICMINLLASLWAGIRQREPSRDICREAAAVFCVLPHPARPPRLSTEVDHLATTHAGISRDRILRDRFRRSISVGLLATCKDARAVLPVLAREGIAGLFRL